MKLSLRRSLFILPNLLTGAGVYCGYNAIALSLGSAAPEDYAKAALFIVYAMFFDTIDGRVARLTRTQSSFGVQIDSLADLISFGVAPAVLIESWSLHTLGPMGTGIGFLYVICGAVRLARFNVMAAAASGAPRPPSRYNLGLPIPGAAGILVAIVVADHATPDMLPGSWLRRSSHVGPWGIAMVVFLLSVLMVSTVRFRSFKNLRFSWQTATLVGLAIGSSIWIAVRAHPSLALLWILVAYVVLAITETLFRLPLRLLGLLEQDPGEQKRISGPPQALDSSPDNAPNEPAYPHRPSP